MKKTKMGPFYETPCIYGARHNSGVRLSSLHRIRAEPAAKAICAFEIKKRPTVMFVVS